MKKIYKILTLMAVFGLLNACDLTLPVEDVNAIPIDEGFQTLADLDEHLLSSYGIVSGGNFMGGNSHWMGSLLADQADRDPSSGFGDVQFINIDFNAQNPTLRPFWAEPYILANRSSLNLSLVNDFEGAQDEKDRISGESLLLRALAHFEVVRYFALPYIAGTDNSQMGIPLRTVPIEEIESSTEGRATVEATYTQIISDLMTAIDLLPTENSEDGRPTAWAARALLAKVYFQQNNFEAAFTQADAIVQNGGFMLNPAVSDIFDPEQNFSAESIWELPSITVSNSSGGLTGLYQSDRPFDPTYYVNQLFASFATSDAADTRATEWYSTRLRNGDNPPPEPVTYVSKFDNPVFNLPMLRFAEVLLIRAESAAETNRIAIAQADLQLVKGRAFGDPNIAISFTDNNDLITQIRDERLKEMAFEFSNIYHDLKRQGGLGESVTIGGLPFDSPRLIFKIPDVEVNTNPLVVQNP